METEVGQESRNAKEKVQNEKGELGKGLVKRLV